MSFYSIVSGEIGVERCGGREDAFEILKFLKRKKFEKLGRKNPRR